MHPWGRKGGRVIEGLYEMKYNIYENQEKAQWMYIY